SRHGQNIFIVAPNTAGRNRKPRRRRGEVSANEPAVVLTAVDDIICIDDVVLDLVDQQVTLGKQAAAVFVWGDIIPSQPRAPLGKLLQRFGRSFKRGQQLFGGGRAGAGQKGRVGRQHLRSPAGHDDPIFTSLHGRPPGSRPASWR